MNSTFPVYDVTIDDDTLGLTAISLVDYPAIQENWVAFSKQQMLYLSNHEKREVIAPVLIPDQLILRRADDGSLYYIRWRRETILQAAQKYIANGWFNNYTYQHAYFYNKDMKYEDSFEKNIYTLRLWTIEDENDDAYTKYGFSHLPLGTLMIHFKCHNRKLWAKIKNKEVMGVSIEAFTNLIKSDVNNNQNTKNNMDVNVKQMSLLQKFVQFLNDVSSEAKDIADEAKKDETNSGEVSLKYWLDEDHFVEVDAEGFVRDEEANLVAEGEYKLADGNVLVVDANNKFVETKAVSEEKAEEPLEAPIAEEKLKDEEKKDDEKNEDVVEEPNGEGDGVSDEPSVEDAPKVDGETEEDGNEETVEEPAVEEPTDEVPLNLVPFEINGVEYQLPQEVVDYINSLIGEKENVMNEIALMKEQMPSASPIPTVINQASEGASDDVPSNLFTAIKLLNRH